MGDGHLGPALLGSARQPRTPILDSLPHCQHPVLSGLSRERCVPRTAPRGTGGGPVRMAPLGLRTFLESHIYHKCLFTSVVLALWFFIYFSYCKRHVHQKCA